MDSSHLTRERAAALKEQACRRLRRANRLADRMNRLGFPGDDPLLRAAPDARDALQGLFMAADYAECGMSPAPPAADPPAGE